MGKKSNKGRRAAKGKAKAAHTLADNEELPLHLAFKKLAVENDAGTSAQAHLPRLWQRTKRLVTDTEKDSETHSDSEPDPKAEFYARMEKEHGRVIKQMPIVFNIPKNPILILQIPTRLRGQTLSAKHMQKPTAFRVKPQSGFIEVDVPVITRKHQRPEQSKNYGLMVALKKKYADAFSNGLSGGFASASDEKEKGSFGGVPWEELYEDVQAVLETVDSLYDTQTYGGRIIPPTLEQPIEMIRVWDGTKWNLSPVFARVHLSPQHNHFDNFRECEDVKFYSEAAWKKAGEFYGSESGDEIYTRDDDFSGVEGSPNASEDSDNGSEAPELPGHDEEYPATDYADTDDEKNEIEEFTKKHTSKGQTATAVNMSVKSSDEKKDNRTDIDKRLDEIRAEKWVHCVWKDEDDPESRKYLKESLILNDKEMGCQLAAVLTRNEYLDLLSCPRFDATKGEYKPYFNHEAADGIDTSDSSDGEGTSAPEDGESQGE